MALVLFFIMSDSPGMPPGTSLTSMPVNVVW